MTDNRSDIHLSNTVQNRLRDRTAPTQTRLEEASYDTVGPASSWSGSYFVLLRVDFDVDSSELEEELDKLILDKNLEWSTEHTNRIISPIARS
jgi:hypothetical protein